MCNTVDKFDRQPKSVSFDGNGHGYVVNGWGDVDIYDKDIYTQQIKGSDGLFAVKDFGGSSIYLYGEHGSGYEPQQCDLNLENCQKFVNSTEVGAISFDSQGTGVVLIN